MSYVFYILVPLALNSGKTLAQTPDLFAHEVKRLTNSQTLLPSIEKYFDKFFYKHCINWQTWAPFIRRKFAYVCKFAHE